MLRTQTMANETPALTDTERVRHYFDVLAYCLEQCADHRDDGHDIFLWNARRASEAVIYALAEGTTLAAQIRGQAKDRRPVDHADLIVQLRRQERLHTPTAQFLEIIRAAGNLGAHTQSVENVVDATTLDGCVQAIPQVVDWLYRHSHLKREMPSGVRGALESLASREPRPSPRRKLEDRVEKLERENEGLYLRLEAARDQERAALVRLAAVPAPESSEPHLVEAPPSSGRGRAILWLMVGIAGGALGGHFAARPAVEAATRAPELPVAAPPVTNAPVRTAPTAPTAAPTDPTAPPTVPPAAPPSAVATPPMPATPPVLTCPEGMRLIPAQSLALVRGPHPRPKWPQPSPTPTASEVAAFCVDAHPVETGAFRMFLSHRDGHRPRGAAGCNLGTDADTLPMNCVGFAEAADFCAARAARLPTAAEWEVAARSESPPAATPGTSEWAQDTYPPAVFGYAADSKDKAAHMYQTGRVPKADPGEPQYSWTYSAKDAGLKTLSFRCATSPR